MVEIKLGTHVLTKPETKQQRLSMLLWGSAGCGKTTLAATAPGKKLWINFDPDGLTSLAGRDDIVVYDVSASPDNIVLEFKDANRFPAKLEKLLIDNPDIETVVFDSVTSYGEKALGYGVVDAAKAGATIEEPGFKGFGRKNTWTVQAIRHILRTTGKLHRHCIIVAHEDVPTKNSDGQVVHITIMLGSSLSEEVPVHISEVWAVTDTGKERRIAVRPCRLRKPMKTRMFVTTANNKTIPEFTWKFNADTGEGEGIADWYQQWVTSGSKIPIPQEVTQKK